MLTKKNALDVANVKTIHATVLRASPTTNKPMPVTSASAIVCAPILSAMMRRPFVPSRPKAST